MAPNKESEAVEVGDGTYELPVRSVKTEDDTEEEDEESDEDDESDSESEEYESDSESDDDESEETVRPIPG